MQIVTRAMLRSCGAHVLLIAALWFATQGTAEATWCHDYKKNRNLYFGDVHVHTSFSHDAYALKTYATPYVAYQNAKLRLDFMAVTDHAEFLTETKLCASPLSPAFHLEICDRLRNGHLNIGELRQLCRADDQLVPPHVCAAVADQVWSTVQKAANQYYHRCHFTTFTGYEYSPGLQATGASLHRNVIFGSTKVPDSPISWFDAAKVIVFLRELEKGCKSSEGCTAISIPHNTNQSEGGAFVSWDMTREEADLRARYEVLVEVLQHKGNSECYPYVNNDDPECGFEQLPLEEILPGGSDEVPPTSFVREGLKIGLSVEDRLGINPFKMGMIGGTDTHSATGGATDEANYRGHNGIKDDTIEERLNASFSPLNPGGLIAVWAEQNTRESIFNAMRRREVYGTSGTRMAVRFFGGWEYPDDLCTRFDAINVAYRDGVAMGSDLRTGATGAPPIFYVNVWQDPFGARLDEIQIIKGWYENGETYERVYTVAGAEDPEGSGILCTVWSDPEFNPEHPAFYYVRAFEVPTPRWSTHDCTAVGVDCTAGTPPIYKACCDGSLPNNIRERAWTSPIWYKP